MGPLRLHPPPTGSEVGELTPEMIDDIVVPTAALRALPSGGL